MNELLKKLAGGDLRSDGRANEVADQVTKSPQLITKLLEGLSESDDVVRGRTTHALERISRTHPEMLRGLVPQLARLAAYDKVPMVRWHIPMIFANMMLSETEIETVFSSLFQLLEDDSVFVKSWAIASLTILARKNKDKITRVTDRLRAEQKSESIAIRTRVAKALGVLEDDSKAILESWVKAND
jgi:HEAT repeat protein